MHGSASLVCIPYKKCVVLYLGFRRDDRVNVKRLMLLDSQKRLFFFSYVCGREIYEQCAFFKLYIQEKCQRFGASMGEGKVFFIFSDTIDKLIHRNIKVGLKSLKIINMAHRVWNLIWCEKYFLEMYFFLLLG